MDANGKAVTPDGLHLFQTLASDPDWNVVCSWAEPDGHNLPLGSKAEGLAGLPRSWVPAWFVLVPSRGRKQQQNHLRAEIERWIFAGSHVVVRSNGPVERYSPGAGRSTVVAPSWSALAPLLADAADPQAMSWPLVQVAIEPAGLGVISNDRALALNRYTWLAEGPLDQLRAGEISIDVSEGTTANESSPLLGTSDELPVALGRLATVLSRRSARQRCEWLWDGRRVWIVQADSLPERCTGPLARQLLGEQDVEAGRVCVPRRASSEWPSWEGPKARSWQFFAARGWPVQPLHVLRSGRGRPSEAKPWLAALLATYPQNLVLRTDKTGSPADLLPTSLPSRDADYLASFADAASADLLAQDPSAEVAVLASPLVPARVSALATVVDSGAVQIDALWGYPDGLLYLPADSYLIAADTVEQHLAYKPACLLLANDQRRQTVLGDPYDWESTLRDDEALQLASWTRVVNQKFGRGTVLMALAHIGGRRGRGACAPFHLLSTTHDAPTPTQAAALRHGAAVVITGPEDLPLPATNLRSVTLLPQPHRERDIAFLSSVAETAREREVPIRIYGSRLSHTRYVLESHGATIVMDQERHRSGIPMLARTPGGLLRLREVDLEPACEALREQLGRSATTSPPKLHDLPAESLMSSAVDAGFAHENFPTVPWLTDDVAAGLNPTRDASGEPGRFMDDANFGA